MVKRYADDLHEAASGDWVWYDDYADLEARMTGIISGVQLELEETRKRMLAVMRDYEELRLIIDCGSESMTHRDAVCALRGLEKDAERYQWLRENDNAFLLSEDVIDDNLSGKE